MTPIVYRDAGLQWRWHIIARNGQVVATSGESFASKRNALRSVKAFLRARARAIEIVDEP